MLFLAKIRFHEIFFIVFLLIFYAILLAEPINLVTADLGRHLKNGELFLKTLSIPQGNLYSYTHPEFPFINHHWAAGVIFFIIERLAGFTGLSLFFIGLGLITFFLFFHVAWKYSRLEIALIMAVVATPVIGSRLEIRPEVFSYLFSGLFFWILWNYTRGTLSPRALYLLPLIEALWVNLHIYFILGMVMVAVFLGEAILYSFLKIKGYQKRSSHHLGTVLFLCILATFFNPVGIKGALLPFFIFRDYGYRLFENQSVWFIERIVSYPPALYFKFLFGVMVASWGFISFQAMKKKSLFPFSNFILTVAFSLLAWLALRNFALFGYFALPIIAINFRNVLPKRPDWEEGYWALTIILMMLFTSLFLTDERYWQRRENIGIGLSKEVLKAAEFFKQNKIRGPIFNNYDIGGYLIYYLYPQERVFVDNRPEAYPSSFFEDIYIPMQERKEIWKAVDNQYRFNALFFYRHDLTPWAQNFLIQRVSDPLWAPVYVDQWTIIFLKRDRANQSVIKQFQLPKEIFSIH